VGAQACLDQLLNYSLAVALRLLNRLHEVVSLWHKDRTHHDDGIVPWDRIYLTSAQHAGDNRARSR
jgi:hypothetical protein